MITPALSVVALRRKLPLPQGKNPLARSSGRRSSRGRSSRGSSREDPFAAFLAPTGRGLALERDGYACVCCGMSIIGKRYRICPRKPGRAGQAAPENLITLLASHASHADPVKGYRLSPQEDPLLVPVLYALATGPAWCWLTPAGKRTTVPPEGASW